MKAQDAPDELARTVAVNTLTIGQVFYLLNTRYRVDSSLSITAHLGNRYLPIGIGAVAVLQLFFTYALPLQDLFGTMAIPAGIWPWLFLGGLVFFFVVEAEKWVIRRWRASKPALVTT
jgi:magnesium-transporting ATPase (P-type)